MKKIRLMVYMCSLVLVALMFTAAPTWALTTAISSGAGSEPDLDGSSGLLNSLYGWSNLTRIDDNFDTIWTIVGSQAYVHPAAKYASFAQNLWADGSPLFTVPEASWGELPTGSSYYTNFSTPGFWPFINDPTGIPDPPAWSSIPGANSTYNGEVAGLDRMVTYYIHSGPYTGDYVMAWEDGIDRDYNDMVYRFNSVRIHVPEPSSMILLGIGLLGFGGRLRKRFKA